MATADIIAFLSLIIALSAYIATIRLRLIDLIKDPQNAAKKPRYKTISKTLTLADAPLIISAAFLFFHGFWDSTLGKIIEGGVPCWLLPWSIYLFTFAGLVLIVHHIGAWWSSITA
jgi:hypothetical protein